MKTVTEMALEAGFEEIATHKDGDSDWLCFTKELERFAALVRADERAECAKVCEPQEENDDPTAWKIAAAIRARSET